MANKKEEGVKVTIPAQVMADSSGKVDLVVEAENVVVNQPMERNGEAAGAKTIGMGSELPADVQAVLDENAAPKTKKVTTGTNVITGEPVVKDVAVPYEKDYSKGRKLFPIHTAVNGSYNGRRINLVKGEEVYLSKEELEIFRNYVSGAGK